MITLTQQNTVKAIARSRELKPRVTFVADRVFNVSSSRNSSIYQVRFDVRNGEKLAECNCKASERGLVCYHITSAAAANIYRQGLKRQQAN